ncbi:hypothetical protein CLV62_12011 [Dysgonomonas alginatilytica]|uniref:DUF6377 domain-containing protein n=1 Tax=Dysgonomonas alginatilytica TaxID=1605892 RepID=A0A2V3PKT6_9BACT|nr:DUF6377 domain-containing protein [Dysgonomonas alginatilytica]PXV62324.1 hypothetical protein CLV62_12011 [Dysgonomonas alginatilytica]
MKNILLLFFLFLNVCVFASNKVDSLLKVLDVTIKQRSQYEQIRELRIDSLNIELNKINDPEERFGLYYKLLREYRSYNMDSALWIANERLEIAQKLNKKEHISTANMNVAEILGIMGMYKESLDIIDQIDGQKLDDRQRAYYFHLYHSIYTLMSENSFSKKEKTHYENLLSQYKDSLLLVNDPKSLGYALVWNGKLVEKGKYEEALALMSECYQKYGEDQSLVGTIAYGLSDVYRRMGDHEQEKKYLIISAIGDQRKAVKGYIALRKLAILLYQEGDVDRAYNYIKCAMEDAIFCKARFRTLEISQTLPIIVAAYDKKVKQEKENLIKYLFLISILSLVLVISVFYIYKQMKKLSAARKSINEMYEDVKRMNGDLNELNKKLSESNLVKEEYIGSVFNLCSTYIDKMEAYRIDINRKLKSGQIAEATKMTNSTSLVSDELKEFFRNFDAIFLNIYPNFVEEFNSLLLENEQILPKAGDILTPELRVFALVRLGIADSSKIASFLHYSPQTVYNYRLKVHNKLVVSKDEFAIAIQQIGK